jgi:hypothetical protein
MITFVHSVASILRPEFCEQAAQMDSLETKYEGRTVVRIGV